jgi:hypothetical protein
MCQQVYRLTKPDGNAQGFDPDLSFAAALGGLINQGGRTFNSTGYFSALGPWELAAGAVLFPSVFGA